LSFCGRDDLRGVEHIASSVAYLLVDLGLGRVAALVLLVGKGVDGGVGTGANGRVGVLGNVLRPTE
jgi:hypothetical protein